MSSSSSRGGVWLLRDDEMLAAPGPAWRVLGTSGADTVELGTQVALVEVPGSTDDALVVSARFANNTAGDTRAGAVYAFRSQSLAGPATQLVEAATAAEWTFEGATSNDQIGQGLAVAPDGSLRIGGPRATPTSGGGERGGVFTATIDFAATAPVSAADVPVVDGVGSGSYFGAVVGVDPVSGRAFALAPRENHDADVPPGLRDGALYIADAVPVELDMPTGPGGASFGTSVAWVDLDGNGADAVAGGVGAGLATVGPDAGTFAIWSGGAGAAALSPVIAEQDSDEELGRNLRSVGDLNGDGLVDFAVVAPGRSYSAPLAAPYAAGTCPATTRSRTGAVLVWLGSSTGIGAQPDFAMFGVETNDRLGAVSGALDHDGDGQRGLAVGSAAAETVWVYDGPWVPTPGQILERCDPELTLLGPPSSSFGSSVAAVPSLNGDACDELAVAAPEDDLAGNSRGALRLFRGCAAGAAWKTWTSEANGQRMGGGGLVVGDLTGNGTPDLAVGSVALDGTGVSDVGAVWFVGENELGVGAMVFENTLGSPDLTGLVAEVSANTPHRRVGTEDNERLGAELAIVGSGASRALWVGRPGAHGGAGGVDGYAMSAAGFGTRRLRVGAEGPYAGMGAALASTSQQRLVVGAPTSDAASVDGGAVYVFELP
ncbi:MAG: hypothetical protein R3F61_37615 [Myxococcota bacterium]